MKGEEKKVSHVVSKRELLFPLIFVDNEAITAAVRGAQKESLLCCLELEGCGSKIRPTKLFRTQKEGRLKMYKPLGKQNKEISYKEIL